MRRLAGGFTGPATFQCGVRGVEPTYGQASLWNRIEGVSQKYLRCEMR